MPAPETADPADHAPLDLQQHGAQLRRAALAASLPELQAALAHLPPGQAGTRITNIPRLRPFLLPAGPIGSLAAPLLGPHCRAVRAVLFNKTPGTNWSLAWHQDRTICVKRRLDVPGFGPWTTKAGLQHVEPPFPVLSRMLTLRVHLDAVDARNAPLLIAPGSHTAGRVPVHAVEEVVRRCGVQACLAEAGDAWLYATPILHASDAATTPASRRVLQVDFTAEDLPGGLEWLGV